MTNMYKQILGKKRIKGVKRQKRKKKSKQCTENKNKNKLIGSTISKIKCKKRLKTQRDYTITKAHDK